MNITDVVSRYRSLVKSGKNFKVLCPFHNDHTPSMIVDPEKNFCWCFACQSGGDMFSFIQKIEGVSFVESIEILAEIAGISLESISEEETHDMQVGVQKKEEKEILRNVLLSSLEFFKKSFLKSEEAKEYVFKKRKLLNEIVENFGLGYAPNSFDSLRDFLISQKYSREQILKSGMAQEKDTQEIYDKFRNRIVFPLYDVFGKICGFGGRSIRGEEPKYLNSPETLLYKKSEILFGYHLAKKFIRKEDIALLVEGNLDALTCHQFGFQNAVAVSGVGFSEYQAQLIKKITTKVVIAFDKDNAGKTASERLLPILFSAGLSVRIMNIPNGKDPDESLHSNFEDFQREYKNAKLALDCILDWKCRESISFSTEEKRVILEEMFPLISFLPFLLEKKEALLLIAYRLKIDENIINDEYNFFLKKEKKVKNVTQLSKSIALISKEEHFWGMVFAFPNECAYIFEKFNESFFEDELQKKLYNFCNSAYTSGRDIIFSDIISLIAPEISEKVQCWALYCSQNYGHLPAHLRQGEIKKTTHVYGKILLNKRITALLSLPSPDLSLVIHFTQLIKEFS